METATATPAVDSNDHTHLEADLDHQGDIDTLFTEITSPLEDALATVIALRR